MKPTPELDKIINEAIDLAEKEDIILQGLIAKYNPGYAVTRQQREGEKADPKVTKGLTKLRASCIEFMCAALAHPDFRQTISTDLRAKITALFFRNLTSYAPDVVQASKEGLRQVCL